MNSPADIIKTYSMLTKTGAFPTSAISKLYSPTSALTMMGVFQGMAGANKRGDNPLQGALLGGALGYGGSKALRLLPNSKKLLSHSSIGKPEWNKLKGSSYIKHLSRKEGFNPSTAKFTSDGIVFKPDARGKRSFFSGEYLKESLHDITHPLESTGKTFNLAKHDLHTIPGKTPGENRYLLRKAAPASQAISSLFYWGYPAMFAGQALSDKSAPLSSRIGAAASNLYSASSPNIGASMGVYTAGDKMFPTGDALKSATKTSPRSYYDRYY